MDSYERRSMISAWNRYLSPTGFLGLTSCSTAAVPRPEPVFSSFLTWFWLLVSSGGNPSSV